ncbi:MAG: DUF4434 domain-containing protein [Lentisphaeria bacterium]
MAENYIIKDFGEYKLFLPPQRPVSDPASVARRAERDHANQAFIESHPGLKPQKRVTGSFIYAHPPNYRGAEAFRYSEEDWLQELGRLKRYGIDLVIFQAALWNELQECYYPSETFSDYHFFPVIEPMLAAAEKLGLEVFLGGYGSVTCWREKLDAGSVNSELARQLACFRELLRYRKFFKGFYFAPESAFTGQRNPELEKFLSDLYDRLFSEIRASDASLQIMMSPATFYYPDERMSQMADAWQAMFAKAHPDILAPQDSIGCGCITLEHQEEAFRQWQRVAQTCHLRLWSNVECFETCAPWLDETARRSAAPQRVACQMTNAESFAEKLISWEILYYLSANLHPRGQNLQEIMFGKSSQAQ